MTKAMTDLRAFRCQITLELASDIPQNLFVVLGEEIFSVMVHLESWESAEGPRGDEPPTPPQNGPDDDVMQVDGRDCRHQANGSQVTADDVMGDDDGELEEVG